MKYTIYKTTNILNNKIYIGKHQTENVDDDYLGSGLILGKDIKKYGRKNFKKEIIFIFDNENEMNLKEKELVTEDFIKRNDNYNLTVGGEGGPIFRGRKHSEETKRKLSEISKKRVVSEETRKKISEANKKRIVSDETKQKLSEKSKIRFQNEDSKKKISETMKKKYSNGDILVNVYERTKEHRQKMSEIMKLK
jgi:hypothetical protein